MKLEVKCLFLASSSAANYFNYQLFEGLEMRKILAHVLTVVHKYKSLLLHINLKLVPFAPNLPVHNLSLISILFGLWSSKSFVKYTMQNSLKSHKIRH